MLAEELIGVWVQDPDVKRVPLDLDTPSDPARRYTVIGGFDFDATVEMDDTFTELVIAKRFDRQRLKRWFLFGEHGRHLPFGRLLSASDNGRATLGCHPASPDSSLDSRASQKFTGQVRDEKTRLDYFGARYYSGSEGRFLSPDPLSGWPDDVQSWNRYVYARNNPLLYTDPTGLIYELCTPTYQCIYDYPDSEFERNFLGDAAIRIEGVFIYRGDEFIGYARHLRDDNPYSRAADFAAEMAKRADASTQLLGVAAGASVAVGVMGGIAVNALGVAASSGATTLGLDGFTNVSGLLSRVRNPALRNLIRSLYRNTAMIPDGGTAAAIRYEAATGRLLSRTGHFQKGRESVTRLQRIMRDPSLSNVEKRIAQRLLNDLSNALRR